jgi:hypothetical protein
MTLTGDARQALRARAPLIAVSILIHVIILLPIGLALPRLSRMPARPDVIVLPLDLTPPWPRALAPRQRPVLPDSVAGASAGRIRPEAPPLLPQPRRPTSPAPALADGALGVAIDDPWRVQPQGGRLGPPARIPCPAAPGDRLGQRLCLTGSAMHRAEMPPGHADPSPAGPDRSVQNREEGFERQVRANEAWRDYTRGEGAYPGLRSLFTDR